MTTSSLDIDTLRLLRPFVQSLLSRNLVVEAEVIAERIVVHRRRIPRLDRNDHLARVDLDFLVGQDRSG